MNSKYLIGIIVAIVVIIGAYFALAGSSNQQTIQIAGSTSVQPVAEKLAQAYMEKHPDVKINVQGGGTSVGITSAQQGTADIGTASSKPKDSDAQGLVQTQIAKDGIVVIVNNANKVSELTINQTKDLFSGNITDWSKVGGSSGTVSVITREDGSGTRDGFQNIVMGGKNGTKIVNNAIVQSSTEAVLQAVKGNPDAVGYISLASLNGDVKAVTINGVAPSEQTVSDDTYKIVRPFIFLTKGEPTGIVKDFIDFTMSAEGQKIVKEAGAVPMTSS
ncbi:phosphate ABC transporter substrate-binding protein [Methanobacterium sp.]|jgi:phosphate transport system substrate-binding protein|uniref:phosphate ABC transporter substrate-binding protein n=1 Tax=Methanobacterium sp. TaxID=2164 RepID=UPI003158DC3E